MIILKQWYVADIGAGARPLGNERVGQLTGYLKGLGAEVYDPLVPGDNGRKVRYSPGYLYLKVDPNDPKWHLIKKGTGIKSIVGEISDAEMEALMATVEHLKQNGHMQSRLRSGVNIVVTNGPYEHLEGIIDGTPIDGKVPVVLYVLGSPTYRQVDVSSISTRTA